MAKDAQEVVWCFLGSRNIEKLGQRGVDFIIALNSLLSLFIKESQLLPVAMDFHWPLSEEEYTFLSPDIRRGHVTCFGQ